MFKKTFIAAALFQLSTYGYAEPAALTLSDCIERAKSHNERLKIQAESIEQARSRRSQARGTIFPDIRWLQSTTWQDTGGVSTSGGSGSDSNATLERRRLARFNAVQPLFSGFKEFSAMNVYDAEMEREIGSLKRENFYLYRDVAQSFLSVIALENDKSNVQTTIKLNEDRIRELKERARVGRSRESEVISAESQLANLKSQEARIQGDLVVAREGLSYLIGSDVSGQSLVDNLETPQVGTLEEWMNTVEKRSDLRAAKMDLEAKRYGVRMARADYWPIVDAEGNYYTHRIGFQREIDWDIILSIDVPIFQGGIVRAQVKDALSRWRQARFQLDQAARLARSEVKQAYASLSSSLEETRLLEDAYKKAKRSYELLARDYRFGLATNLDVLQALTIMQDVKQGWDRSETQSKLSFIDLAVAAEQGITP